MKHYVYFVKAGSGRNPPIKIGVAKDVEARIRLMQTGNPNKMRVVASIPFRSRKEAFDTEAALHKRFAGARREGEWFHGVSIYRMLPQVFAELSLEKKTMLDVKKHGKPIKSLNEMLEDLKRIVDNKTSVLNKAATKLYNKPLDQWKPKHIRKARLYYKEYSTRNRSIDVP